jgi:hypothetical protein
VLARNEDDKAVCHLMEPCPQPSMNI